LAVIVGFLNPHEKAIFTTSWTSTTPETRASPTFQLLMLSSSLISLVGAGFLSLFHCVIADDAGWARGYRAGSKLFKNFVLLDLLSSLIKVVFNLYVFNNYSEEWWTHYTEGGVEYVYVGLCIGLAAVAFFFLACSTFLLETYHDLGTDESFAHTNVVFAMVAFITHMISVFSPSTTEGLASIAALLTFTSTTVWAMNFELQVNDISPSMIETELTNSIEQEMVQYSQAYARGTAGDQYAAV